MATAEEKHAAAAAAAAAAVANHITYKDALVDGEPDPELKTDFQVDPAFTTSQPHKEKGEPSNKGKNDGTQSLKSNLLISGAVIAVIATLFTIVKKIKEA